jgi:NAD(P)-dependent dehydrogenase (short-subunit alcohol dehydrogenase family)
MMTDSRKITGLRAVVTGSTRGIGRAIAEALVRRGDRVVVSGRDRKTTKAVAAQVGAVGPGEALGIACDVRKPVQCERLIAGAVEGFGGLDVLVNNAGLGRFARIDEMSLEDWDVQIRTNLDGVFHCSRAAIPHLRASAGGGGEVAGGGNAWIINIGSLAGRNPFAGGAAYNATKFGLLGMSEAMMLDLRHEGIRVTCVMPGSVATDFDTGGMAPAAPSLVGGGASGGKGAAARAGRDDWKLTPEDVAQVVTDLLDFPARALPSRVEIRPSRPPRRG